MSNSKFKKLKKRINYIRIGLSILTLTLAFGILGLIFTITEIITFSMWSISLIVLPILLYYPFSLLIIYFTISKTPTKAKEKLDNTLMIYSLPIIGMWLWLPNKKELEKIKQV